MMATLAQEPGLTPLAPASLPELIADRIIEAVGRGQLLPRQHLVETELSEQLSVSRIPLREALRVLQSQGIVVAMPRRGVRLISFDRNWARELYDVRVALERVASHVAAAKLRADPNERARLNTRIKELELAAEGNDRFALNAADLALHSMIFDIAGRPLLLTMWAAIARHVLVSFSLRSYTKPDPRRIVVRHRALRAALLRGSEAEIDAEVARHLAGPRDVKAGYVAPLPKSPARNAAAGRSGDGGASSR